MGAARRAGMKPMASPARYLSRIRLSHFRNYAMAALDLDARHLVLTGPNGAGKTNLLEAVSLFSPGRGLRRAPFDTLGQIGSGAGWAVAITLETPDGPVDLGTGLQSGDASRRVRLNGADAPNVEALTDYVRLIWLTPSMDGLFTGPAGDRRRFYDRLVMTLIPGHGRTVADYESAMRQRNRLIEDNADPLWIDAIEAEMAERASAIHFARMDCIGHLQRLIDRSLDVAEHFPAAGLSLTPLFEDGHANVASSALEAELIARWRAERPRDRAAGRTLTGPHRTDLEIVYRAKAMPAALASTGEQKALLIGLILAHARLVKSMTGIAPLLLLDEVAAHLDPARRAALFAVLDALETQCVMTGTDALLFEALGARGQFVRVENGALSPTP